MLRRPRIALVLALMVTGIVGCTSLAQQTKASAHATCGSSCKTLPAESQSECITRCTK